MTPNLKIFALLGALLCISGVAQVLVRPRGPSERGLQRYVNRSTIQMVLFVGVGILGILVGTGVVPVRLGR